MPAPARLSSPWLIGSARRCLPLTRRPSRIRSSQLGSPRSETIGGMRSVGPKNAPLSIWTRVRSECSRRPADFDLLFPERDHANSDPPEPWAQLCVAPHLIHGNFLTPRRPSSWVGHSAMQGGMRFMKYTRMRCRLACCALILTFFATLPGSAQFFRPLERIPEPTVQDADPGIDHSAGEDQVPAQYRRQPVVYRTHEAPGTIIIDTADRFLYLIQPNNVALRYGIGVGRDGFTWAGILRVSRKAEWPDWTPPAEMISRQPYLPRWMAGGTGNPLGARAMYLGNTVYRIPGTNAPETIRHAVTPGCF